MDRKQGPKPKGKGSGRGKKKQRPFPNGKRPEEASFDAESPTYMEQNRDKGSNDVTWYSKHPQLVRDIASFPYGIPLGRPLDLGFTTSKNGVDTGNDANFGTLSGIPGVMALYTSPTIGYSIDPTSPINVAMSKFYADLRFANNASSVPYEAPDLGIYLVAMDSCYSYLAYLRRIYGLARTYSVTNRYLPEALFAAMRVDFNDVQSHLADFRASINTFAVQLAAKALPAGFSYTQKHIWMYDYVYADSDTDKAQMYLFVPHAFYQFAVSGQGTTRTGSLVYKKAPGTTSGAATVKDLVDYGRALLSPIINDEDYNIMAGDIRKAYKDNLLEVPAIAEDYTILPLYNQEVLQQIENATMIGYFDDSTATVVQATSATLDPYLVFEPKVQIHISGTNEVNFSTTQLNLIAKYSTAKIMTGKTYLNFHHGDVTPEDTMEASRLTNILTAFAGTSTQQSYFKCETMGSEVCHSAIVYYYYVNASGSNVLGQTPYIYTDFHTGSITALSTYDPSTTASHTPKVEYATNNVWRTNAIRVAAALASFDWHPKVFLYDLSVISQVDGAMEPNLPSTKPWPVSSVGVGIDTTTPLQDMDVFTILDKSNLQKMSFVALMSQFWSADPQRST